MNYIYQLEDNKVVIQKYTGNEKHISVPERIQDYPVIKLAPYAFAEQRKAESIILPDCMEIVGSHTFYNCRKLKQLSFSSELADIGDGVLKNCYELKTLIMRGDQSRMTGLKYMLEGMEQETEVIFPGVNRLIFPSFVLDYQENTAARTIHQDILGAGYAYRNTVFTTGIDYREYDQLFYKAVADSMAQSIRLALYRLCWPYHLLKKQEEKYYLFIKEHMKETFALLMELDEIEEIEFLLKQRTVEQKDLNRLLECASERENLAVISLLMNYQNQNFKTCEKNFEL